MHLTQEKKKPRLKWHADLGQWVMYEWRSGSGLRLLSCYRKSSAGQETPTTPTQREYMKKRRAGSA